MLLGGTFGLRPVFCGPQQSCYTLYSLYVCLVLAGAWGLPAAPAGDTLRLAPVVHSQWQSVPGKKGPHLLFPALLFRCGLLALVDHNVRPLPYVPSIGSIC